LSFARVQVQIDIHHCNLLYYYQNDVTARTGRMPLPSASTSLHINFMLDPKLPCRHKSMHDSRQSSSTSLALFPVGGGKDFGLWDYSYPWSAPYLGWCVGECNRKLYGYKRSFASLQISLYCVLIYWNIKNCGKQHPIRDNYNSSKVLWSPQLIFAPDHHIFFSFASPLNIMSHACTAYIWCHCSKPDNTYSNQLATSLHSHIMFVECPLMQYNQKLFNAPTLGR